MAVARDDDDDDVVIPHTSISLRSRRIYAAPVSLFGIVHLNWHKESGNRALMREAG